MTIDDEAVVSEHLQHVDASDQEALRSQAAYASGRFEEYWEARGNEAQARLDAIYGGEHDESGSKAAAGDSQQSGDSGSGDGSGSEGSRTPRSQANA